MRNPGESRDHGRVFEELFLRQAQRNGLLAKKNEPPARRIYGGRLQQIKGSLDYMLVNQRGRLGFFDCKSFGVERFVHSALDEDQVETAQLLNDWNVPAGFVVWFRPLDKIVYITGFTVCARGPGESFGPDDGRWLGGFADFDLKRVLD